MNKPESFPELGTVLLAFYECLTDPGQLESLMAMITSWLDDEDGHLVSPQLDHHAEHAWNLLGEIAEPDYQPAADVTPLTVSRFESARAVQGAIGPEIRAEDQPRLREWLDAELPDTALLLRVQEAGTTELVILSRDMTTHEFLVKRTGTDFQALISKFVADSFELTHAEFMLVQELLQGGTLREISDRLGKSWETTRSQVKSLTNKLGVNSQSDILRIVNQAASLMPAARNPATSSKDGDLRTLQRPDGRSIVYEIDGPPSDKTLVYLHGMLQGRHWPEKARALARSRGWRVVRISRAGRGGSSLNRKENVELLQDHCDDLIAIMNHEGIDTFSMFGSADGFAVGYHTALQHPDRVQMIVGLEVVQPILSRQVVNGFMGKMKTYGLACLYAPKTVRYMFGLAIHKLARMEDRYEGVHPLIGLEMKQYEDADGIDADDRNYQDIMAHRADGVWRDASFSCYDWAYAPPNANIRPPAALIHSGNSMMKYPGTLEEFAQRIRASVHHIDCYLPYVTSALPTALDALEER